MCLAIPGQVTNIKDKKAWIAYPGNITNPAMIAEVPARIGDYVLVQMGIIIKQVDKDSAQLAQDAWLQATSK